MLPVLIFQNVSDEQLMYVNSLAQALVQIATKNFKLIFQKDGVKERLAD
jgi:hypothetical protein